MHIEIQSLTKSYSGRPVLAVDSLRVDFDHCLAFLGPSGGGKSTLLRILAGLVLPDTGSVKIDGVVLPCGEEELRRYRAGIGVVFQAFNLFPHLTARENILLPLLRVHGLSREEATERTDQLLKRFGLFEHAGRHPVHLSGGQRQRVAIIRAIATRPKILFLDEPTSSLDPEMTREVLEFLLDLREQACPLVLVTHEVGFARAAADQAVFLSEGKVEEVRAVPGFFQKPDSPLLVRFLDHTRKFEQV
jgi:polar amino acid transport system ATP-binding protein